MGWRSAHPAGLLAAAQAIVACVGGLVAGLASGRQAAFAALYGGAIALLPTLYFAMRVRLRQGGMDARQALGAIYRAEVGKLLLTLLMFVVGARWFGDHYLALMLTCMAGLAMNWVVLAVARSG